MLLDDATALSDDVLVEELDEGVIESVGLRGFVL